MTSDSDRLTVRGGERTRVMRRALIVATVLGISASLVATGAGAKPPKPGSTLDVTVSATGHWSQSFSWSIAKTAASDHLPLSGGTAALADYTVAVTKNAPSDEVSAGGEVCVTNPAAGESGRLDVTAAVTYRIGGKGKTFTAAVAAVDTTGMPTLPAGASHCFPYSVVFAPVADAVYTAAVTVGVEATKGRNGAASGEAGFVLPESPSVVVNGTVHVDDGADTFVFSDTGAVDYGRSYTASGTYVNTALIRETGQEASATVTVAGCYTTWDAVAYWCFDDQATPTADGADGHPANLVGPSFETASIAPVDGNVAALRLDGVDDHGSVPDPDGAGNLDGFSAITIAAWVRPDAVSAGPYEIVTKYASGGPFAPAGAGSGVAWGLDIKGGVLRFVYNWEEYEPATTTVPTGTWTHVAGTWDGTDVRLYINGVETAHGVNIFTAIPDTATPVNIGSAEANVSGNRFAFFDGLIDEAYVFDRALSPAEINHLAVRS